MPIKGAEMLAISRVLGELISAYTRLAKDGDREYRLLAPGLTQTIARELHEYLLNHGVNTFLVVGSNEEPNEAKRLIRPVGLTSKRIGSFVAVASPGQLVHIQDSIRGSGGAIRSLAFSEEWPWIDSGSEPFRFSGPVLDALVQSWSTIPAEQDWLREFVLNGLLPYSRSSPERAALLLENILGSFDSSLYPAIKGVREKFLYHAGIPCPRGSLPSVAVLIRDTLRLCRKIVERCQREEDIRDQSRDMIQAEVAEKDRPDVRLSLDCFLDGMGRNSTLEVGLLAFHRSWGEDKGDPCHWSRLDADLLARLFGVKEQEQAEITCTIGCDRSIISVNSRKAIVATFVGEKIQFSINYAIPGDQFAAEPWKVQILHRQKSLAERDLTEDRGDVVLDLATNVFENHANRIPLRVALVSGQNVRVDWKLDLHLCGEQRPGFVVVEPGFEVVDPALPSGGEVPDKKIDVDDPVHISLLSHSDTPSVVDENDDEVDIIETVIKGIVIKGIWKTSQRVDVAAAPSVQVIRTCKFGQLSAVLCFEANDLEKGEFTVEDELREMTAGKREKRLKDLMGLFLGKSREPYMALGSIDKATRRRIDLAKLVTNRTGWKPLLADLLKFEQATSGPVGDFVNHHGAIETEPFKTLSLPEDALGPLKAYSEARSFVQQAVESGLSKGSSSLEHPVYASHPIFIHDREDKTNMESLIKNYLDAYGQVLGYLEKARKNLEWSQLFVLVHLDCVVHWDASKLRNSFFLVGPWHPLVVAKRYMIQSALVAKAARLASGGDDQFRRLVSLLGSVQGFRWLLGLAGDDAQIEPAYASITSDPGWYLAFKTSCPALETPQGLADILSKLRTNFGLATSMGVGGNEGLATTSLSSYTRAFPSRRSVGVRVRHGYAQDDVVRTVDSWLHADDGPTERGLHLPGGVRLYLEERLSDDVEARWSGPPLQVYRYADDEECIGQAHPDIYMLPPVKAPSFNPGVECRPLPRGSNQHAVFSQALSMLTEGQTLIPKSMVCEHDAISDGPTLNLGEAFVSASGRIGAILGGPIAAVHSVDLPQKLGAPWAIIPGRSIDPAILVKYVRDGSDRAIQDRALWDFKLDVGDGGQSFFILSSIPKGFQVSVNGFFGTNVAEGFIVELGKIGIAIGGEALKSGRHALGVVGMIGAVRLLIAKASDGRAPLPQGSDAIGFLVPVDSFLSFFGKARSEDHKRADLLAIHLTLPKSQTDKISMSACGIESKFVAGTFTSKRANDALKQAQATVKDFKDLVLSSLSEGGMPERLALLEIVRFGLRVTSPSKRSEIPGWVEVEKTIYDAILTGRYQHVDAKTSAVLVTTEGRLPGVAEHQETGGGYWVRLTKGHWPIIAESPQVDSIRKKLCDLFDAPPPASMSKGSPSPKPSPVLTDVVPPPVLEPANKEKDDQAVSPEGEVSPIPAKGSPLERIFIGVGESRRAIYYDPQFKVDPLDNMNLMVTGSSGTGKTQFLKYLICRLREQGKNVLVVDFKNDFASDKAFCDKSSLEKIFASFDGLPFNPLIPYPVQHPETGNLYIQCAQYISGVSSVLKRTYGLGAQQQVAVKNAIVAAFSSSGITTTGSTPYTDSLQFPDFANVGESLQHDNPSAYNRLDPLFTLGLFRPEFRSYSFDSLVSRSAVLDLSQIPSDEIKNTLAQLLVLSAHAYYNTKQHSGTIRQVLVFDEAHRVLSSDYMLHLVRECRAYGVSVVLSSQYPSDFPAEISSSMATKIVHGNGRDIDRVKAIIQMLGCEGREGDVANLGRFQAFVDNRHYPGTLLRTMNYPLFLVWSRLLKLRVATREELSQTVGIDTAKLPMANLIQQLEQLGIAEEREGRVILLGS